MKSALAMVGIWLSVLLTGSPGLASGPFDGLAGEYRGTSGSGDFVLWADILQDASPQVAVLLFIEARDRPVLEAELGSLIDHPKIAFKQICQKPFKDEYENRYYFPWFPRVWKTGGGLVVLQDTLFFGQRVPADWEEIEASGDYPDYLFNDEMIQVRSKEYMVRRVRRNAKTGALTSLQLTRTGFIQNFFDNPVMALTKVSDTAIPLVLSYVQQKQHALDALGEDSHLGHPTPVKPGTLPAVCQ